MKHIIRTIAPTAVILLPSFVFAAIAGVTPIPTPVTTFLQLVNVLESLANIIFTLLMIAAVIAILYAAFNYLTAGGDTNKVSTANNMVLYAALAIAVGVLAKGIPIVVRTVMCPASPTGC